MQHLGFTTGKTLEYYWLRSSDPAIGLVFPYLADQDLFNQSYWVIPDPGKDMQPRLQFLSWLVKGSFATPYLQSTLISSIKDKQAHALQIVEACDIYLYYQQAPQSFSYLEVFSKWPILPFSEKLRAPYNTSYFEKHLEENQPDVYMCSNAQEFLFISRNEKDIDNLFYHYKLLHTP